MSAWLTALLLVVIAAAVVGIVPLRRYADRQWAEHVRRQRVASMPEFQRIAESFVELKIVLRDSFTPALARVAASIAELSKTLDQVPPQPRWRRAVNRIRTWLA